MDNRYTKPLGMIKNYKIVALGGGTGLSTMLRGIKKYTHNITAIVTMADDGGGSGMIRNELNLLPPGDLRNCILSLSDTEAIMEKLLQYRFPTGNLKGQSFGNLFIAAMCGITNSFDEAIKRVSDVLAVKGRVLPVTTEDINLCAVLEDRTTVKGESIIPKTSVEHGSKIKKVYLSPEKVEPFYECIESILSADLIILGPGSLYTSIIPNILVDKIAKAIYSSTARVVYVCNIMTQRGESDNMTAFDHIDVINKHAGYDFIDYCIVNNEQIPEHMLQKYIAHNRYPVVIDEENFEKANIKLVKEELLDYSKGFVRHNYDKLARTIIDILCSTKALDFKF